jgi:murein DD-endopeptidase MepM/ murein hydrolase activator NlpD
MKILNKIECRVGQLFGNPDPKYIGITSNGLHNGIDYPFPTGTPIKCVISGKVEFVGEDDKGGKGVYIISDLGENGAFRTIYWHFLSFNCKVGDLVQVGDIIGLSDNTGYSFGAHLHFGIKKVKFNGKFWDTINNGDGFNGAIDPFPLFSEVIYPPIKKGMFGQFVLQIQKMLNEKTGTTLAVDGKFGPITEMAVRLFQRQHNLTEDGIFGTNSMNVLNNL